jgi:hypothetical protein
MKLKGIFVSTETKQSLNDFIHHDFIGFSNDVRIKDIAPQHPAQRHSRERRTEECCGIVCLLYCQVLSMHCSGIQNGAMNLSITTLNIQHKNTQHNGIQHNDTQHSA